MAWRDKKSGVGDSFLAEVDQDQEEIKGRIWE